jgi:hypothetical protein
MILRHPLLQPHIREKAFRPIVPTPHGKSLHGFNSTESHAILASRVEFFSSLLVPLSQKVAGDYAENRDI